MNELVPKAAGELIGIAGSAIGAAAFTAGGLLTEQTGIRNLMAGQTTLGGWEIAVGLLFLLFGVYLLGYQEFWGRLQALRAD
jgi:hypothetical protein